METHETGACFCLHLGSIYSVMFRRLTLRSTSLFSRYTKIIKRIWTSLYRRPYRHYNTATNSKEQRKSQISVLSPANSMELLPPFCNPAVNIYRPQVEIFNS